MTNISRRTAIAAVAAVPAISLPSLAHDEDAMLIEAWRKWSAQMDRLNDLYLADKWDIFYNGWDSRGQRDSIRAIAGDPAFTASERYVLKTPARTMRGMLCKLDAVLWLGPSLDDDLDDLPWCILTGQIAALAELFPDIKPLSLTWFQKQVECERAIEEAEKARQVAAVQAARCKHCGRV